MLSLDGVNEVKDKEKLRRICPWTRVSCNVKTKDGVELCQGGTNTVSLTAVWRGRKSLG